VFPKLSGDEFDSFMALAEKLRADYDFAHTLDAKFLPRGESVEGPAVRLFKPFDELFVDSKVKGNLFILYITSMRSQVLCNNVSNYLFDLRIMDSGLQWGSSREICQRIKYPTCHRL